MMSGTPMGPAVLGSRLDRLVEGQRLLRGLTRDRSLREVAAASGISIRTLSEHRLGRRAPSQLQLEALRRLVAERAPAPEYGVARRYRDDHRDSSGARVDARRQRAGASTEGTSAVG